MDFTQKELHAVLQSKEGQQLLKHLQADGGKALSQATAALKSGDTAKAMSLLRPIMESPASAHLVQEINRKRG